MLQITNVSYSLAGMFLMVLVCVSSGCDLGTYGSRVAEREDRLNGIGVDDTPKDTKSDFEHFHTLFNDYISANQIVPNSWQDIRNLAADPNRPLSQFESAAMQRLNERGYKGNWGVDLANSPNAAVEPILFKPDNGGNKVLYNGTVIPDL